MRSHLGTFTLRRVKKCGRASDSLRNPKVNMFAPFSSTVPSPTGTNCSCSGRPRARMSTSSSSAVASMSDAGDDKPSPPVASRRTTVGCILCGGIQIYPGPRYENHLVNEHGAVFDVDFLIELSLFKQKHCRLPALSPPGDENANGVTSNHETGRYCCTCRLVALHVWVIDSYCSSHGCSNRYIAQVRGDGDNDGCPRADGG